ncbi:ABC transporter permease [Paraburkholderia edwinii]|jgi:ribose transport system permease protein|uniref:ABC transporter permease n=1 Tax=Paraburkholderia edwinii TaxID=2861782 RepID=A0ABX8USJ1_9BURK|nr:ABC transporter permease [Paraburkholderia edwinii]QYD71955.1 ABC transporter permease [Paraburkholderia edwinii]
MNHRPSSSASSPHAGGTSRPQPWYRRALGDGTTVIIAILAVLTAIFAATQSDALSPSVLTDILNNSLPLALAAAGGTLVVLTRGFDLSVAGVVSLTNVLVAVHGGSGPWGALQGAAIAVAAGAAVGAINGYLVAYWNLQSIALTLATMIVCSGVTLLILDAPGGDVSDFMTYTMTDRIGGAVPVALAIAVAVFALWRVLRRTDWGVGLYGTGADESAALLAGVPVRRVKLVAYVLAGVCYGLAGFMLTALTSTGTPNAGDPYLLLVFAAIALGGTSFAGGRGGVAGSMLGALTLTLLQKVLFSTGVSSFYTGIFQGVVMIAAVVVAVFFARVATRGEAHA